MQDFEETLCDFTAGRADISDLLDASTQLASHDEKTVRAAMLALDQAYADGTITHSDHARLKTSLVATSRSAYGNGQSQPVAADPGRMQDETAASFPETALGRSSVASRDGSVEMEVTYPTESSQATFMPPTGMIVEDLKIGDLIKERFALKEILGIGGMGTVFKALDQRKVEADDKNPFVAIKVLNADFRANHLAFIALQREAMRAQKLSHPNIITVYDFDRDGPHAYMSMELLTGEPLTKLIRRIPERGLTFKQVWPIVEAIAKALSHAHHMGIVHSDLKPGNVFIDNDNNVKVLDFGIACAMSKTDDHQDTTLYKPRELGALTPAYASYEQWRGEAPDPRDDVYALGCVTYELLTGKHPFGKLAADQALGLNLQPKPIMGLPRRQWKALQHALALKKADRTPGIDAFVSQFGPRSSWAYGMTTAVLLLVALIGFNLYLGMKPPVATTEPSIAKPALTPEQHQKIADLLELASTHFDVGYYTAPTGSNALWAYREALKIDPYSKDAQDGIKKIADTLEQEAWEAYDKGDRAGSMKKVLEGLEVDSRHMGLLQLQAKLRN